MSLRSRIRGGLDLLSDGVATAAQFLTLRSVASVATNNICDDPDGPGHAPRYLDVRLHFHMILDSQYWKRQLLINCKYINSRLLKGVDARSMDKLQYAIICGFLIIRRLLDSHKVTDSTAKEVVNCSVYGLKKGRRVTYIAHARGL